MEAPANGTLILSAVAALLYLALVRQPSSFRRTFAKTASTALLGVLVLVEGGPLLLAAALFLSALGDLFLAEDSGRAFVAGLCSFLVAHLVYVALFGMAGGGLAAFAAEPWRVAAAAMVVVFAGGMFLGLRPALPGGMVVPVAIYVVAILAMGIAALTLPSPAVIVGAVLFMASDAILASGRFLIPMRSERQAVVAPAVWVLYYTAQACIALGFLLHR
ncbi:lysoplasmalogenase [Aquibium carbonis]|uniref:lysoplasmalogenase n=1 Tax=Aquibium carbonis TaxID=2495581 RepID=UPI001FDEF1AE|nr:lysoplasmalogenase [Aquibium carbonis]